MQSFNKELHYTFRMINSQPFHLQGCVSYIFEDISEDITRFPWLPSLQGNRCLEIGKIRASPLLECSLEQESNCWQKEHCGVCSPGLTRSEEHFSASISSDLRGGKIMTVEWWMFSFLLLQGKRNLMEHSMVTYSLKSFGRGIKRGRES